MNPNAVSNASASGGYCPHCGDWSPATALNCSGCGGPLPWASSPASPYAVTNQSGPQPAAAFPDQAGISLRRLASGAVSSDIGVEIARGLHVASHLYGLLISLPFVLFIAGVFRWAAANSKLPWSIAIAATSILALILIAQVATVARMAKMRLQPSARPAQPAGIPVAISSDEQILLSIAGILWAGWRTEALGVGRVKNAHSALVVTDRHILLLVVPVAGAGQIVGGTDYGLWQFMAAGDELRARLDGMLSAMSLEQILLSDAENLALPLAGLRIVGPRKLLGVGTAAFTFITPDGRQLRYNVRTSKDIQALSSALGV